MLSPHDITIRPFKREDIESLVGYFESCSEDFLRAIGVDKAKFPPKPEFISSFKKIFDEKGEVRHFVIIEYQGRSVGHHNLTHLREGEDAIFHGQIWEPHLRGKGLGLITYLKACDYFTNKLNLRKILFKTPKQNIAANRVKEKLGLRSLGETIYEFPLMTEPALCNLYELDLETLRQLKSKVLNKDH